MKLYKIHERGENKNSFAGTLDAAKQEVNKVEPLFRAQVLVTETEVANDKDTIIAAFNELARGGPPEGGESVFKDGREWHGTSRGGLKAVAGDSQS